MNTEQFFTIESAKIVANILRPIFIAIEILRYLAPAIIVIVLIVWLIKKKRSQK